MSEVAERLERLAQRIYELGKWNDDQAGKLYSNTALSDLVSWHQGRASSFRTAADWIMEVVRDEQRQD